MLANLSNLDTIVLFTQCMAWTCLCEEGSALLVAYLDPYNIRIDRNEIVGLALLVSKHGCRSI